MGNWTRLRLNTIDGILSTIMEGFLTVPSIHDEAKLLCVIK